MSTVHNTLELPFGADPGVVAGMLDTIETFGERHGIDPKRVMQLSLVLDELVTNVISYGSIDPGQEGQDIGIVRVEIEPQRDRLLIDIVDEGVAFNPIEAEAPDTAAALEDRKVGGLGIMLVRNYVEEMSYLREGQKNHLKLVMKLSVA
jgi:serine/threonine-protein kinase RsbW